jgi:multiple sugar transport system permease protein
LTPGIDHHNWPRALSLPGLGVATLFGFLVAWNEFVIALTLTRTPGGGQTMPVGISTLITQFQVLWGKMMAVAAIYLLPVFALTILTQRGLVRGLMTGATKG